jgi:hypothetical protein
MGGILLPATPTPKATRTPPKETFRPFSYTEATDRTSVLSQKFADKVSHSGHALWVGPSGPTIPVDQEKGF